MSTSKDFIKGATNWLWYFKEAKTEKERLDCLLEVKECIDECMVQATRNNIEESFLYNQIGQTKKGFEDLLNKQRIMVAVDLFREVKTKERHERKGCKELENLTQAKKYIEETLKGYLGPLFNPDVIYEEIGGTKEEFETLLYESRIGAATELFDGVVEGEVKGSQAVDALSQLREHLLGMDSGAYYQAFELSRDEFDKRFKELMELNCFEEAFEQIYLSKAELNRLDKREATRHFDRAKHYIEETGYALNDEVPYKAMEIPQEEFIKLERDIRKQKGRHQQYYP